MSKTGTAVRADVTVQAQRLETEWIGPPPDAAPTLVFLHEGLGCLAAWRGFPARLAAATGCGALVYSRAGYGGSDAVTLPRPLDYMEQEGRTTLPELLATLGVRRPVLVGHSDGASIALVAAGSGLAVAAVIAEAPHVVCEDVAVASVAKARDAFMAGDLRVRLGRYHGGNVDVAFWGWAGAWSDPRFKAWSIEAVLPRVTAPVLVIQGDADPYGTLRQVERIEAGCPGPVRRLVLAGCGHTPHRERAEETLAAMTGFVREALGR
jgi:pimeloyl-ACP methyl ester carboxylesterase